MHYIFILSDGTGRTAEQTIKAALTQFPEAKVTLVRRPEIRTEKQVVQVVKEAAQVNGFIVHTVVSNALREVIAHTGRLHNVETIDLMGPLLAQLSHQLAHSPSEQPGLFGELNKEYFRRIEAMEFAFDHDDGQRVEELRRAEIVLVGVSRTFKTPLSIYLAFKGWFVANVPIILEIPPPPILFDLPPERVFGLTIDLHQLVLLRRARHEYLGGTTGEYADPEYVRRELMYAHQIFTNNPQWPIINVTNKPIEEIASEILAILRKNQALD
ncbi:MAG: kinase/pyrophosphorylase [Nitrospinota bacterium]|nr:MAG: kinase/pyrophosphorylase [Nitrospinota bacterium]